MDAAPQPQQPAAPALSPVAVRRFLGAFFGTLLVAALVLLPNTLALLHVHELGDVRDVAAAQKERGGLFGSGIREDTARYKWARYRAEEPDIVALGSSRVMQFRASMFRGRFYNLGGTMQSLSEGEQAVAALLEGHKPRVILVGLDFFWWNGAWPEQAWAPPHDDPGPRLTVANLLRPFKWLGIRKVSPGTFVQWTLHEQRDFGVHAVLLGNGFALDGHREYGAVMVGKEPSWDRQFSDFLGRTRRGDNRMEWGAHVDEERWRRWERVAAALSASGARVVTFVPPLVDPLREAMDGSGHYRFVDELRARLVATHLAGTHLDLHSASKLALHDAREPAAPTCEFLDAMHGGTVVYARIAERLAEEGGLGDVIDVEEVRRMIASGAGRAELGPDGRALPLELDFLEIGCDKRSAPR